MKLSRRHMIGALVAAGGAALGKALSRTGGRGSRPLLRPPGAGPEEEFASKCIRCFQCGDVCPNGCIQFHGISAGPKDALTPYINPRQQGCIACMKCTHVCPTGALTPIDPEPDNVIALVKMGVARLNMDMCYSYAKPAPRTCGVCYRACPFPGKAMTIGLYEQPTVHRDKCIGCGLCEQSCVHLPQAIRVIPIVTT